MPATGSHGDGVRWQIRHHHTCTRFCATEDCGGAGAFPWWKPRSYRRFWRLVGRDWYWPPLITIWHREPGGADALDVCQQRIQRPDGTWRLTKGWRWHVRHWKIQVHPAQALRRRLLTRCAWCGGRERNADPVNTSFSWDGPRGRWWQGEPGLYHRDCSAAAAAWRTCPCDDPIPAHETWGECLRCGKSVPHGRTPEQAARARQMAAVPHGTRPSKT
jgi:hypothetical protein